MKTRGSRGPSSTRRSIHRLRTERAVQLVSFRKKAARRPALLSTGSPNLQRHFVLMSEHQEAQSFATCAWLGSLSGSTSSNPIVNFGEFEFPETADSVGRKFPTINP